jgi:tetratricopeptide (TPR) repeat protein/tRNA A-37 threonylcarbamoyl transferase component Bud32
MGTVWMAEQTAPVKRRVALKVIKPGMDSRQVIARFEQERQALALMDHPHIAKVHDAGTTATGRPYFVMELVQGVSLTRYCDEHRLTPRQRLELFLPVCQAVQHAHQKGVIHRDLKPSNVLVALYDGRPVPKVIDFGIAKAAGQQLTEHTLVTGFGAVVGTLEYMSPEQAELNQLDIDTRSDIYALGVLLYELLTGTTPLEKRRLKEAALLEVLRRIREEEPPRPSARLSSTDQLPAVAANRSLEPKRLSGLVRGELDWVVMKCLEKDRSRRYDTANGLALDLQRYLTGEPVLAVPPSAGYRLRKFAGKYRAALTTAAALTLLLVAGVAVSTWAALRATEAEARAWQSQQAESRRTEKERQARQDAQKRLKQIEKGNEILTSIFADLNIRKVKTGTQPLEAVLAKRLVKAADELEGEAVGDPLVVARLQDRLGAALLSLGHPRQAIPLHDKARQTRMARLGPDNPDTLTSMNHLASAYQAAGKLDLALPLFEETLKLQKAKQGARHPHTLTSMNNLALAYRNAGKLDLALPLFKETLKLRKAHLGADHPDTLVSMNNLASAYQAAGKLDLALLLAEETLKLLKAKLGAHHPHTLSSMNNLAWAYQAAGKLDLALPLFEETLKLWKAHLGADHPDTLVSMNNLALAYWAAGKLNPALSLFLEAADGLEKRGFQHQYAGRIINNLANCYEKLGHSDRAALWRRRWQAAAKGQSQPTPATVGPAQTQAGPFVILPRDGRAEKKLATLAEAVLLAWDGDTIEVRGNGPFPLAPIILKGPPLRIRAGEGFRPVFHVRRPGQGEQPPLAFIVTHSLLVLEGLEFQEIGLNQPVGFNRWSWLI